MIKIAESYKFLGVDIYNKLEWRDNTNAVYSKEHHHAGKDGQQYCWGATGQPGDGSGEVDNGLI